MPDDHREEEREFSGANSAELYRELQQEYGLTLQLASLQVAVNDQFSNWETELKEGDHIVFLPPVSGG